MADPSSAAGALADPYRAYNFKLEIQGVTEAHFTECSGLGVEIDSIEYREAGQGEVIRKIPGQVHYGDLTLQYGLTRSVELWEWLMSAVQGKVQRKNISIIMVDADGATEAFRWNLLNAWPSKWQGVPLNTMSQEIAIESITLVYEGLERN